MEISIKSTTLFSAILLTGLSAGLFYAWSVSVIPGTKRVSDITYLETMQAINRAILNPAFYTIFFGSVLLLGLSTFQHFPDKRTFAYLLAATLVYLIGTFGVTAFGNVPLNNGLDVLNLTELGADQMAQIRQAYEVKWNRLHTIRTLFAVCAFILSLLGVWTHLSSS